MPSNNDQRQIIAKWLADSATDGAGSSSITDSLGNIFKSGKFNDIQSFAGATFTHLDMSQLGIDASVLAKAQARAQEFVANKTEAVNMLASAMKFLLLTIPLRNSELSKALSAISKALS